MRYITARTPGWCVDTQVFVSFVFSLHSALLTVVFAVVMLVVDIGVAAVGAVVVAINAVVVVYGG